MPCVKKIPIHPDKPKNIQISRASSALSSTISSTTEPIRNTAAYKTLSETLIDALDDSGSAKHAGFEEKEARRQRRQMRLLKAGKTRPGPSAMQANPEHVTFFLNPIPEADGCWLAVLDRAWFCIRTQRARRLGTGSRRPTTSCARSHPYVRALTSQKIPLFPPYETQRTPSQHGLTRTRPREYCVR